MFCCAYIDSHALNPSFIAIMYDVWALVYACRCILVHMHTCTHMRRLLFHSRSLPNISCSGISLGCSSEIATVWSSEAPLYPSLPKQLSKTDVFTAEQGCISTYKELVLCGCWQVSNPCISIPLFC